MIPSQRARPPAAVRSVLIYDARPGARAALTLRITAAVPSVNDITCAARPANLIATFAGRPAALVFIGVESEAGDGVDAAGVFLSRYPTARVLVFGTANDIPALITALSRGAAGVMLWQPLARPSLAAAAARSTSERNPPPRNHPRRTRNPAWQEPGTVQP